MRISTIAVVALVLLAGAVGYYFGAQQRHVEPDGLSPLWLLHNGLGANR